MDYKRTDIYLQNSNCRIISPLIVRNNNILHNVQILKLKLILYLSKNTIEDTTQCTNFEIETHPVLV